MKYPMQLHSKEVEWYSNCFSYYHSKSISHRYVMKMELEFNWEYNLKSNPNQIYYEIFREFM